MSQLSSYLPRGLLPVSQQFIYSSEVMNFSTSRLGLVCLIGGGGGGAVYCSSSTYDKRRVLAQGGNAGGCVYQLIRFEAGTNYTFTIGSGGGANSTTGGTIAGQQGTSTSLASTALPGTLSASGGVGGSVFQVYYNEAVATSDSLPLKTAAGGSNADLIYPGGQGGAIELQQAIAASPTTMFSLATGGGAVNIYGAPQALVNAGSITMTEDYFGYTTIATGGGGIGGNGGSVTRTKNSTSTDYIATGGGGSQSAAADLTYTSSGGVSSNTVSGGAAGLFTPNVLFPLNGSGSSGKGAVSVTGPGTGGAGGGGGGHVQAALAAGGNGGLFAGGGAGATAYNSSQDAWGGDGNRGGGGGAAIAGHWNANTVNQDVIGGAGGAGVAMLWLFSDFGRVV